MDQIFTPILGVIAGLGLAAACGFRIFVPAFVLSIAAHSGAVHLSSGFAWIGSTPALIVLGVATVLEVGAYYIPVVDNLLDSIATPAAVLAGVLLSSAMMGDIDPWLRWSLATIAGGGLAAAVQIPTAATRGVSTASTAGLGNSLVSTGEAVASTAMSVLAVLWPLLIPIAVLAVVWFLYRRLRRGQASPSLTPV
jgi:hypothetical protein